MNEIEKNTLHPQHYRKEDRPECWNEMISSYGEFAVFCFDICNAHKYMYRAGEKDGNPKDQDLAKIKNYVRHAEKLLGAVNFHNYAELERAERLLKQLKENLEREGIDYGK